jgi:hypothetical protein
MDCDKTEKQPLIAYKTKNAEAYGSSEKTEEQKQVVL